MPRPIESFDYCPRCAAGLPAGPRTNRVHCDRCGFTYYLGPAVAAAGIIRNPAGRVLLLRRAKEPARGKWAFPGGFVDADETAENALRRETREEVGLELTDIAYLCSRTNAYHYREITYPVLDLFFLARPQSTDARPLDGAESVHWLDPDAVDPEDLSFPSVRAAWQRFLETIP